MDLQQGIILRLKADGDILAAVGSRISWGERIQGGTSWPAIVLQVISDPRPANLQGYEATRSTLIQMDVFALTYAQALSIARSCIEILKLPAIVSGKAFGASFVDSQRDTVETKGTLTLHRQSVDFNVWHKGD